MRKYYLLSLVVFLLLASCASSARFQPYTEIRYAPTKEVRVFTTQTPEREYIEIGMIEVTEGAGGGGDMLQVAIKKAKEIGADGLILVKEDKDTGYIMIGNMLLPGTTKKMVFIAIKFKE